MPPVAPSWGLRRLGNGAGVLPALWAILSIRRTGLPLCALACQGKLTPRRRSRSVGGVIAEKVI